MGGRGSLAGLLPYGDANAIVVDMAREVLPVVQETPVLAGVCGTDPFRLMPVFLDELRRIGFSGVQNFPTVGLFDGTIRVGLEETGMGYGLEVDMIRLAHERDFLTAPYVFNDDEATAMAQAGADVLVPHMGLTTGGAIGADTAKTLDESVQLVQACTTLRSASTRTSSCCATAGRSPSPTTPPMSSRTPRASSASSARRRWSACRPRLR